MAADPVPLHFVLAGHRRQQFPQIPICNGFSAAVAPLCRIRDYAGLSPQLTARASMVTGAFGIVRDQSVILG